MTKIKVNEAGLWDWIMEYMSDDRQKCPPQSGMRSDNEKKERSHKSTHERCHRQGPITRNPFLNFLREYRKQCCGKNVIEVATEGGKVWRKMSDNDKHQFKAMACNVAKSPKEYKSAKVYKAPRTSKSSRVSKKRHRRSSSHKRKRSKRRRNCLI